MGQSVSEARWTQAQGHEGCYWRTQTRVQSLLDTAAALAAVPGCLGDDLCGMLFHGKEVLELGVGPLGLSVASFYRHKDQITRLVKLEPLPQLSLYETPAAEE